MLFLECQAETGECGTEKQAETAVSACLLSLIHIYSLKPWFDENLGPEFMRDRTKAMGILQNEASLNEIVQLVGKDALGAGDQLTLEVARMVREDFLQQNAFMDVDSFSDYERQKKLLGMILSYDVLCRDAIAKGASAQELFQIPAREQIGRAKSVPAEEYAAVYDQIQSDMEPVSYTHLDVYKRQEFTFVFLFSWK